MARKLRDGFKHDSLRTEEGALLPIVRSISWPFPWWAEHNAPAECFEPEETLSDLARRRVAEIRQLQAGGAVYVQVDDCPVAPGSGTAADAEVAGKCGVVMLEGDGTLTCRVQFATGPGWYAPWGNNLTILDTIPPEFAEEDLGAKAKRIAAEIRAKVDAGETVFVRMADEPVCYDGSAARFSADHPGDVGRAADTSGDGKTCRVAWGSGSGDWYAAHNLTILTPEEVLDGLNRGKGNG